MFISRQDNLDCGGGLQELVLERILSPVRPSPRGDAAAAVVPSAANADPALVSAAGWRYRFLQVLVLLLVSGTASCCCWLVIPLLADIGAAVGAVVGWRYRFLQLLVLMLVGGTAS